MHTSFSSITEKKKNPVAPSYVVFLISESSSCNPSWNLTRTLRRTVLLQLTATTVNPGRPKGCRHSVNSPSSHGPLYFTEEPGFGMSPRQKPIKNCSSQMRGVVTSAWGNRLLVSSIHTRALVLQVPCQVPEGLRSNRKWKSPFWQISPYLAPIHLFLHARNTVKISLK